MTNEKFDLELIPLEAVELMFDACIAALRMEEPAIWDNEDVAGLLSKMKSTLLENADPLTVAELFNTVKEELYAQLFEEDIPEILH